MEDVATFGAKNLDNTIKSAINAKKLGVEFSSIVNLSSKLLDFESSISAQMEASALLGREINLDKAREAALAGDMVTLQKEIAQQVGSEAQFNEMNVLQRKKLADAMGVSVADLAKIVKGQEMETDLAMQSADAAEKKAGMLTSIGNVLAKNAGAAVGFLGSIAALIPQMMTFNATKQLHNTILAQNTVAQNTNTTATQAAGTAAKSAGSSMLTMGAAILMIGAGIGLATVGIAQLADSLKGMTGGEMAMLGGILLAIGAGIFFLGQASLTASPGLLILGGAVLMIGGGIMMMGVGLGIAAAGMSLLVDKLEDVPFENLLALPVAFMGIGAGLYMMAAAGLAALPILGALTAFAVVAPALSGLGQGIGQLMGGTEGDDGKMDTLISEVRGLRTAMATPVIVTLDGRKLGEGVRNNTNYNRVR